jgi:hypothetical protein
MRRLRPLFGLAVLVGMLTIPLAASGQPVPPAASTFDYTENMRPLSFSGREIPLDNTVPGAGSFNSDLAFWGKTAVQGTYAGFRLIDISAPARPKEILDWEDCASRTNTQGNQGDVIIWRNLLIRSWNSPTPAGGSHCGDWPMAEGEEGVHVIDISDPLNPDVVAFVDLLCGSHTETLMPDLENDRLLVYSNSSAGTFLGAAAHPIRTSRPPAAASTSSRFRSTTRRPHRSSGSCPRATRTSRWRCIIRATTPRSSWATPTSSRVPAAAASETSRARASPSTRSIQRRAARRRIRSSSTTR